MSARELITEHLDLWTGAVTQKSTRGRGSNAKVELTGINKLRELILELAIRGKLVEQCANEEPAKLLLERVKSEKHQLVVEGEIKKPRKLPSLSEMKPPFSPPRRWEWAQLEDIGRDWGQKTPDRSFSYIDVASIDSARGVTTEPSILSANDAPSRARKKVQRGTLIYSTVRPYLQNIAVIENEILPEPIASTAFAILHPLVNMPARFFLHYLRSTTFVRYVESVQTGIAYPAINDRQFFSGVVPIPPVEEQHRIVQKVDELMALCDRLEQQTSDQLEAHETLVDTLLGTLTQSENTTELADNWARLAAHFDTLFTTEQSIDKLKQTILQLAVMGRLVEQDAGDEPASNLLKCIDEEIGQRVSEGTIRKPKALALVEGSFPYELPKGWRWEKLGRFTLIGTGATPSRGRPDYYSPPEYPWVTSGETSQAFICDTKERVSSLAVKETNISIYPTGTLIVAMYGQGKTRGQITELKVAAGTNQACAAIQPIIEDANHRRYIKLCFVKLYDEIRENAAGGAQPNLNTGKIANTLIPLPPLAEQHRIVQKVDELMALCDQLKERLNQASETRCQLADTVVETALG